VHAGHVRFVELYPFRSLSPDDAVAMRRLSPVLTFCVVTTRLGYVAARKFGTMAAPDATVGPDRTVWRVGTFTVVELVTAARSVFNASFTVVPVTLESLSILDAISLRLEIIPIS